MTSGSILGDLTEAGYQTFLDSQVNGTMLEGYKWTAVMSIKNGPTAATVINTQKDVFGQPVIGDVPIYNTYDGKGQVVSTTPGVCSTAF